VIEKGRHVVLGEIQDVCSTFLFVLYLLLIMLIDFADPALWYTGHGYAHSRYYSRFLAMRIKADVEGRPIPQWTENL
jgi:hypothetical protein